MRNRKQAPLGWTTQDLPATEQPTPTSETKASLTIQNALKVEAKPLGILGNYISVIAISSGVAGMSISNLTGAGTQADPYIVEIKLGTTTTNNTMTLISVALTANTDVAAVINNFVLTGATQMTAFSLTALSSGINGTVGFRNQAISDTNNANWTMKYDTDGCYYWSPDGFPAVNTEYFDYYCSRVGKVYKIYQEGTTPASTAATIIDSGATFPTVVVSFTDAFIKNTATTYVPLPVFTSPLAGTLVGGQVVISATNKTLGLQFAVAAGLVNKPFIATWRYVK